MHGLPPGQAETKRFPFLGELRPAAALNPENWQLLIGGAVEAPVHLTLPELLALPRRDFTMDVHCVTGWTRFQTTFTGIPLAELLARVRPVAEAKFIQFIA